MRGIPINNRNSRSRRPVGEPGASLPPPGDLPPPHGERLVHPVLRGEGEPGFVLVHRRHVPPAGDRIGDPVGTGRVRAPRVMSGRAGSGLAAARLPGPAVSRLRPVGVDRAVPRAPGGAAVRLPGPAVSRPLLVGVDRAVPRAPGGAAVRLPGPAVSCLRLVGAGRAVPRAPVGRTALVVCGQSCLSQCLKGLGGTPQGGGGGWAQVVTRQRRGARHTRAVPAPAAQ